jgi:hypothetical protein
VLDILVDGTQIIAAGDFTGADAAARGGLVVFEP